ncbi:Omega-6 fatty acid desaturase, endoplasmic reticulum isozyme 1 [Aphelenchoides bicaudatus]|nr:Omega-6 fatty acid desaturase, endoplasmic reticulum isozyme 1 [Aphelenchoides bicaudatus]
MKSTSKKDLNNNQVDFPTLDEIRQAIPKHCMQVSVLRSTYYFLRDLMAIAFLYLIVGHGLFMAALFLIGHDAVHGLFANQEWINILIGHLSLSPVLIPYYPWNKIHAAHHKRTYHVDKDQGHPWVKEDDYKSRSWFVQNFCKIPISAFFRFHMYMMLGFPDGSHFNPWSKLITNNKERFQCCFSVLTCVLSARIAYLLCGSSFYAFFKFYYVPLVFQNFWLVMITYLNHQDDEVDVFGDGNYKYIPAQFETIDRYFGFGIDGILHNATDGHVLHHLLFRRIPHYHLTEATEAVMPVFEKYPGAYKRFPCTNFVWEFLRLNFDLEYLVGKGTGVLRYAHSKRL